MIDQPAAPGYSKARGLLAVALGLLAVGLAAGAVSASLWAEVGDATLRGDIELLANYGMIEGPLITWPVPWAQISKGLHVDPDRRLPAHVRRSLLRVRERLEQEEQEAPARRLRGEVGDLRRKSWPGPWNAHPVGTRRCLDP